MAVVSNKRSVITLFSGSNDPYSHRARIVLAEKGVTFDLLEVDTNLQPQGLVEVNPYNTVPTLLDRDLVLYESGIIMEYLDERFPHPPLMPVYPVARARTRLMFYRIDRDWYKLMDKILQPNLLESEKDLFRTELKESLTSVAALFSDSPFFLSEEFSLVDCSMGPLLWRLPSLGIKLGAEAKVISVYAHKIFSRESFQVSLTDAERALSEIR